MAKTSAERLEELRSLFVGNTHVYIDFANVRKHCAQLGWAMDLRKLKTLLGSTGKVKSARTIASECACPTRHNLATWP